MLTGKGKTRHQALGIKLLKKMVLEVKATLFGFAFMFSFLIPVTVLFFILL